VALRRFVRKTQVVFAGAPGISVYTLRRRWANLIRRVYETDPLVCPRCGAEMRVIGFITEPSVIKRILDHIRKRDKVSRSPPPLRSAVAHIA
jgi:hypothetical protein